MSFSLLDGNRIVPGKSQQKCIENTFFLKLHISLLRIYGLCSFKENFFKSKMYGTILNAIFVSITIFAQFIDFRYQQTFNFLLLFVFFGNSVCCLSLFTGIIYSNIKSSHSWRNLLGNVCKFDMDISEDQLKPNVSIWNLLLFIIIHLIPFFLAISMMYLWLDTKQSLFKIPGFISLLAAMKYQFEITVFLWRISSIFHSRYQYLTEQLQNILQNYTINEQIQESVIKNGLTLVKYKYKVLYDALQEINRIFAWIIPPFMLSVLLLLLRSVNALLHYKDESLKHYLIILILPVISLVSRTNVIFIFLFSVHLNKVVIAISSNLVNFSLQ